MLRKDLTSSMKANGANTLRDMEGQPNIQRSRSIMLSETKAYNSFTVLFLTVIGWFRCRNPKYTAVGGSQPKQSISSSPIERFEIDKMKFYHETDIVTMLNTIMELRMTTQKLKYDIDQLKYQGKGERQAMQGVSSKIKTINSDEFGNTKVDEKYIFLV